VIGADQIVTDLIGRQFLPLDDSDIQASARRLSHGLELASVCATTQPIRPETKQWT
jgi:hypothetical protein